MAGPILRRRAVLAGLGAAPLIAACERTQRFHFGEGSPTAGYIAVRADELYDPSKGYGFEAGGIPAARRFSIAAGEGAYRVTLAFGGGRPSVTTVKAESRRLMLERVTTGRTPVVRACVVDVRNASLPPPELNAPGGAAVRLNEREAGSLTWDDRLTLEFCGETAKVTSLTVEPVTVPTIYLAGDSTVTDQQFEPAASWGQMLPAFFDDTVAVANHAESGEALKSFLTGLRLDKALSRMRAGDWFLVQFTHNDSKAQWPQTYAPAENTFRDYLKVYIGEARRRGATPVLLTPPHRRRFDAEGRIVNSHGSYPEAIRAVGAEAGVAVVDLTEMSRRFYEALGPAEAPLAFSAGGQDPTHHNNYGAYQLARCVAQGLRDLRLPLAARLRPEVGPYDPGRPPSPRDFDLTPSAARSAVTPRGS